MKSKKVLSLLLPVPLPVLHPAFPDTFQESVSGSYLWHDEYYRRTCEKSCEGRKDEGGRFDYD